LYKIQKKNDKNKNKKFQIMSEHHYSNIIHSIQDNTLTVDFKNTTEILIAESIGSIPKDYSVG